MSKKRAELEQAATSAVQSIGFSNLSFRTLAEEVGVKSSSVHYYFPEKSDLAAALIDNYTETFLAELAALDKKHALPERKLLGLVGIFEQVNRVGKYCLCGIMAAEVASLNDSNRQRLEQFFSRTEHWVGKVLDQHTEDLSSALSNKELARIILAGLEGSLLIDRVHQKATHLRAYRKFISSLFA